MKRLISAIESTKEIRKVLLNKCENIQYAENMF